MRIMWFCIPAFGHTNPTVEFARELARRGHDIRYYSFEAFRQRIEAAGAAFVPCDRFLPPLTAESERRLKRVSTTEMSVQSFRTIANMDATLTRDIEAFHPDLVISDSACFWGKLTAMKHRLPLVCSTTTFAFNRYSSKYMRQSLGELADILLGLPRLNREAKRLAALGYPVKSALEIVQNDNDTDTVVYTSPRFQPCSETFDAAHYRFVGPCVRDVAPEPKDGRRPLVYISLGTVINDRPDFYRTCVEALKDAPAEALIACGRDFDPGTLAPLPGNIRIEPSVDQMAVLARTRLFVTHCGMNSASEGLYMAVPELLYPQTGEQRAVARRVEEMGAGRMLTEAAARDPRKLRALVMQALGDDTLSKAASAMRDDLRACGGASAAADFVETVIEKY
ncbi:MAG: glycosyl transferase [Clostridia bacterium]|nr:glycosyl transferase [Clostridia bacterium]